MEKIVKFCAICEESFAENFSFCPNCATALTDYEMNPVIKDDKSNINADSSYHITFVDNRSSKVRQNLLLGAFLFVTSGTALAMVMSIYNADAYVSAIDENMVSVFYTNSNQELILEEETETNNNKKKSGGGGGDKDPNEVSKGRTADQIKNPDISPSVKINQVTNPELVITPAIKGDKKQPPSTEKYGDPNSKYDVESDGPGTDKGQGNGRNRGQGDGDGPGLKIGRNGGCCGGDDDGGNRQSDLNRETEKDNPPPPPGGVTQAMKIISKPRAIYTDAARRNLIAGTVTLRVTFMANGSIGNIVVVGGLADGLTEQAIAAARSIQFEPAKRNGVPTTVTKQVQYTFTLY